MSEKNKFTPLPSAQTDRFTNHIRLPDNLQEEIGINTHRLHTLLQIGGLSTLYAKSQDANPTVSNISLNPNGTISARSSQVKQESYQIQVDQDFERWNRQAEWPSLAATIHPNVLQENLAAKNEPENPEAIARELNRTMTQVVVNAGVNNLVNNISTFQGVIIAIAYGLDLLSFGTDIAQNPEANVFTTLASKMLLTGVVYNTMYSVFFGREKAGEGHRASLFFGINPDRALLLFLAGTYTRTLSPMIKPLEQE